MNFVAKLVRSRIAVGGVSPGWSVDVCTVSWQRYGSVVTAVPATKMVLIGGVMSVSQHPGVPDCSWPNASPLPLIDGQCLHSLPLSVSRCTCTEQQRNQPTNATYSYSKATLFPHLLYVSNADLLYSKRFDQTWPVCFVFRFSFV